MDTTAKTLGPGNIELGSPAGAAKLHRQKGSRTREGKHRIHATKHAVLSRYPLEALARRGQNIRELRRIEKLLRAQLKPHGIVGEIIFDRAWSSHLRCLLAALSESETLARSEEKADAVLVTETADRELSTAIWPDPPAVSDNSRNEVESSMAVTQRYDSHFSREFYRALTWLMALNNGGDDITKQLGRTIKPATNTKEAA